MDNSIDLFNISDDFEFNSFGFELQDLSESLNDFWIKNQTLIEKCQQIRDKANRHKTNCDIAKSVGTGVSAIGGVALVTGVVLTPFTAGVSGLLCIGGGVATAAGSLTTVGTDFADTLKSKNFCSDLKQLAEERDRSAQILTEKMASFDKFLGEFLHKEDFNRDLNDNRFKHNTDFANFMKFMAKGTQNVYSLGNNSTKMLETVKDLKSLKAVKTVSNVKSEVSLAKSLSKSVVSLAPTEAKGVGTALARTTGANAGKLAFRGVSAGLGLAITAVDVFFLVKDWNKNHPTIGVINGLIEDLEKDFELIRRINRFITSAYTNDSLNIQLIEEIINSIDISPDSDINCETEAEEIVFNCNKNTISYHKN